MNQAMWAVALAVVLTAGHALGGELGTRLEVGDRSALVGWAHLSGDVGGVSLSGRVEGDLLCGCLRRLQLAASTSWEPVFASAEAVVLATGRTDLSLTASWRPSWRTELGSLSTQAGGKGTVVDVLGGRFITAAGWAFVRLDRDRLWVEGSANATWPGGSPQLEARLGLAGPRWVTFSFSGTGSGLELGAEEGALLVQSYVSLHPRFQTLTIGLRGEGVRFQGRITARAGAELTAMVTVGAVRAPWQASLTTSFTGQGLDRVTAEIRYTLSW